MTSLSKDQPAEDDAKCEQEAVVGWLSHWPRDQRGRPQTQEADEPEHDAEVCDQKPDTESNEH